MNLKPTITPALVIGCSYCGKVEICYDLPQSKSNFEKKLRSMGWTINEHNAVKCGPCNWKDGGSVESVK